VKHQICLPPRLVKYSMRPLAIRDIFRFHQGSQLHIGQQVTNVCLFGHKAYITAVVTQKKMIYVYNTNDQQFVARPRIYSDDVESHTISDYDINYVNYLLKIFNFSSQMY